MLATDMDLILLSLRLHITMENEEEVPLPPSILRKVAMWWVQMSPSHTLIDDSLAIRLELVCGFL